MIIDKRWRVLSELDDSEQVFCPYFYPYFHKFKWKKFNFYGMHMLS